MITPRRYREHDQVVHSYPTLQQRQLADEWVRLNADPAMRLVLARWARSRPELAGLARPGDVLDHVDAAPPPRRDAVLVALLTQFQAGQSLAGRILLQAMLPKLSGYALRDGLGGRRGAGLEERFQRVVCEFWEVICGYPVRRRATRVAANLALDTLHRLTRRPGAVEVPVAPDDLGDLVHPAAATPSGLTACAAGADGGAHGAPDSGVDPDWSLGELLAWALGEGRISPADADLLRQVYGTAPPPPGGTAAPSGRARVSAGYAAQALDRGASSAALRQRVHRARARLADAVDQARLADALA